ncbi:hypothetical protein FOBRF1_013032 [Fusarium oxysporum]
MSQSQTTESVSSLQYSSLNMAKGDDGHSRPLPLVQTFDAATAKVNDIVAALMRTGGCVLKGAIAAEDLAQIEKGHPHLHPGRWRLG